jgi:hypothetical protein
MKEENSDTPRTHNSVDPNRNQTVVPPNTPPDRVLKPFVFIGIIVIVVILVSIGLYIVSRARDTANSAFSPTTIPNQVPSQSQIDTFKPPPLYPEFEWKKNGKTTYEDNILYDSTHFEDIEYKPTGEEWVFGKENIEEPDEVFEFSQSFTNYYTDELTETGWDYYVNLGNRKVSGLMADGVGGGVVTYLKQSGNNMRSIVLETYTTYRGKATEEVPFSCPCDVEFQVFISDIFSTTDIERGNGSQ